MDVTVLVYDLDHITRPENSEMMSLSLVEDYPADATRFLFFCLG
jgi:hypothetical protein